MKSAVDTFLITLHIEESNKQVYVWKMQWSVDNNKYLADNTIKIRNAKNSYFSHKEMISLTFDSNNN